MNPVDSTLAFYSGWDIDKIVQQDTLTFTVNSGTPVDFGVPPNSLESVTNTSGKKALIVASWSIDGTNYNSTKTQLRYYNSTLKEPPLKASVNVGCDDDNVYFWLVNNYTSNLTFTINYAVVAI